MTRSITLMGPGSLGGAGLGASALAFDASDFKCPIFTCKPAGGKPYTSPAAQAVVRMQQAANVVLAKVGKKAVDVDAEVGKNTVAGVRDALVAAYGLAEQARPGAYSSIPGGHVAYQAINNAGAWTPINYATESASLAAFLEYVGSRWDTILPSAQINNGNLTTGQGNRVLPPQMSNADTKGWFNPNPKTGASWSKGDAKGDAVAYGTPGMGSGVVSWFKSWFGGGGEGKGNTAPPAPGARPGQMPGQYAQQDPASGMVYYQSGMMPANGTPGWVLAAGALGVLGVLGYAVAQKRNANTAPAK